MPNNDDGDLTYYKRRDKEQLSCRLIGGTGQVTQAVRGRPAVATPSTRALPAGFTAMPSAEPGPNGFR